MANRSNDLSAAQVAEVSRMLGRTALRDETVVLLVALPERLRPEFLAGVRRALDSGLAGPRSVWVALNAVGASLDRGSAKGGAAGGSGVCEGTDR